MLMQPERRVIKDTFGQNSVMGHSDDIETKKEIIQVLLAAAFILLFFLFWGLKP